ncbi:hypothetical protein D6C95_01406 [Aureobasidium pullulans]|nr:hypothetical protein D6C95_01406 [Aureobasidium pullulans]
MSHLPSKMERQDSGNPADNRKTLQSAAVNAAWFTPSTMPQKSIMSPFGNVFTPSKGASSSLASTFGDFHTPSQGSAMKFLNAGSTAEGSSTKRSSLSPVKPVGSGFSSPSRVSAPLVQGPVFSTDTDPNTSETRFVCFDLIPEQWTQNSADGCVLNRALEYTGLIALIDTAVGSPSEVPGFVNIFCRFDDLRAAAASKTLFETVLTTVAFNFISHHEYFGADHTNPRAQAISAYDGQVEFTAVPNNILEINIHAIYAEVLAFAKNFGDVRSFSYIEPYGFEAPRFRSEYFSVKSAEKAIAASTQSDAIFISAKEYSPRGYVRYAHPAAQGGMDQLEIATRELAIDDGYDNGRQYQGFSQYADYPPRRGHGPRRARGGYRGGYRGHGGRGALVLSEDSIVHQTDMEFWRFNQPQTVNLLKIEAGVDVRTTVMLRNIPNRVDSHDLKEWLDKSSFGHYDFSYLRIDFSTELNVGYAFVNFTHPEHITNFVNSKVGKPWNLYGSTKRCEVSYATIQGIDCLLAKFRNSVIMEEAASCRPKLWYHHESDDLPDTNAVGTEAPFPAPNNEQKRKRSRDNATTIGLFPSRHGRGPYGPGSHYREGQYDRGTSFAIEEERQHEEQRQVRFERRQLGYRGNGQYQQFGRARRQQQYEGAHRQQYEGARPQQRGARHRQQYLPRRGGGGYYQQGRILGPYDNDEDYYDEEEDDFYHGDRDSDYYRR